MKVFLLLMLCLVMWRIVKPNGKLYNFDAQATLPLRGILALFIMFHHVSQRYDFTFGISFLEQYPSLSFNLFTTMGAPVVGVFLFLTGYGLSKSLKIKGNSYVDGFISKRFLNTLPEFVFLTILVSVFFIFSGLRTFEEITLKMGMGEPPLPNSWFMYAIIYVYVAFYLAAIISKCNVKTTGFILTLFVFAYIVIIWKQLHWGNWWYVSMLSVPFGYFVATFENYCDRILLSRKWLISLTLLFIMLCIAAKLSKGVGIVSLYGIVALTYACVRLYGLPRWKPLLWLGEISLNIYLIHGLFVMAFNKFNVYSCVALICIVILSCLTAYGLKEIRNYVESKKHYRKIL